MSQHHDNAERMLWFTTMSYADTNKGTGANDDNKDTATDNDKVKNSI